MSSDSPKDPYEAPLFACNMPGIMTKAQLEHDVDLDKLIITVRGQYARTSDLVSWAQSSLDDPGSIKCIIAELVAAIGPRLMNNVCVRLG